MTCPDDGFGDTWAIFAIAPRHEPEVDDQLISRGIELVRAPDGSVFEPQRCDDSGELTDAEACSRARAAGFELVRVPDTPRSRYWSMLVAEPWPEGQVYGASPGASVCIVPER
jgi:hypothetical protein